MNIYTQLNYSEMPLTRDHNCNRKRGGIAKMFVASPFHIGRGSSMEKAIHRARIAPLHRRIGHARKRLVKIERTRPSAHINDP